MSNVIKVFEFLRDFNKIKNKVIINIDEYSDLININEIQESEFINKENINESDVIISIKLVEYLDMPRVPDSLEKWLKEGYGDFKVDVVDINETITILENNLSKTLSFYESEKRVEDFFLWEEKRKNWVKENRKREYSKKLFRRLYALKTEIDNEAETFELVYSDYIIEFVNKFGNRVKHPLFSKKIEINYIDNENTIEVRFKDSILELNSTFLRHIEVNPQFIQQVIDKLDTDALDFSNPSELFIISNSIAKLIRITFSIDNVLFYENSMIYKRKKNQGYARFIDQIIDDIELKGEESVPSYLYDLVYHSDSKVLDIEADANTSFDGLDRDVLLTLPANEEQIRIVKSLKNNGAVLVQGPPGTGKTHTIANLIGHYLSEGKSILVASQTEKALSVLKEKVFKGKDYDLRSMCINLSKDKSQRTEMDLAISALAEQQSNFDPYYHKSIIEDLKVERENLILELSNLKQDYIKVKNAEYKDFVYDNATIKPLDAAKYISEGKNSYDYLNVKTKNNNSAFPLTYTELSKLYALNYDISEDDEIIINSEQINANELINPVDFSSLIEIINNHESIRNFDTSNSTTDVKVLIEEKEEILKILSNLSNAQKYGIFFNLSIENKSLSKLILEEINKVQELLKLYDEYDYNKLKYQIEIDYNEFSDELIIELLRIEETNQRNAFNGLLKNLPKRKRILNSIKTKLNINDVDQLMIFNNVLKYEIKYFESKGLIEEYFRRINYNEIDLRNFHRYSSILNIIKTTLELYSNIEHNLITILGKNVIEIIKSGDGDYLNEFIIRVKEQQKNNDAKLYQFNYETTLDKYKMYLSKLQFESNLNSKMNTLYVAVRNKDTENYEIFYNSVLYSKEKKNKLIERDQLLLRVESISEELAENIRKKEVVHSSQSIPDRFFDSWKYAQLKNQLDSLNELNKTDIRDRIKTQNQRIVLNAQKLAHHKAWLLSMSRLTIDQKRNINAWKQTIRKIGAGKGKKAPMLIKEAQEIMTKCQSAIPVWIMPLSQVVETFNPSFNKFDVLIIDEASQADLLALSVLYLGKQIIIVGDDKQVSPNTVGIKDEVLFQLQNQYLINIPNFKLYDDKRSLYDLALLGNFQQVVLREHFRCYPDIISFSNKLYYNNRIEPLRDGSSEILKPSVVEYRVANGYREPNTKLNKNEAQATVSLLLAMLNTEEYKNKTFGIISMLGHEQASYIWKLILESIDVKIIEDCKITVGSPSHFQGDERDIVFINIVDSQETVRLISSGALGGQYDKEYNVATSRARDQLWVVHSLNPERDLNQEDLRYKLIQHIREPRNAEDESSIKLAESVFEKEVMTSLISLGYKVIPQYKVGSYRIDMIIYNGDKRVALECDGEKYHGEDKVEDDLMRQIQLERLGWNFIRLRGSLYFSDKEKGIDYIVDKLNKMDIYPVKELNALNNESNSILSKVKQQASVIDLENTDNIKIKKLREFSKKEPTNLNKPTIESKIIENNDNYKVVAIDIVKDFLNEIKEQKAYIINEPQLTEIERLEKRLSETTKLIDECIDADSSIIKARVGDYIYNSSFGYGRVLSLQNDSIEVRLFLSRSIKKFRKDPKFIYKLSKDKLIDNFIIN